MKPQKIRMIIDCDAGIDDAQAILMAINCPHAEIVAITTSHGNVDVDQVNRNVLRVLDKAGRMDIDVYSGCTTSLTGARINSSYYHGQDGLGDAPDPDAPNTDDMHEEHASQAMVRLANKYPGELTLVCLAPLTNIAVAMRIDSTFPQKILQCYIMGGNYEGRGNITPFAEFNFLADPESAEVVLKQMKCEVTLICWELCLESALDWEWYKEFIEGATPLADFMRRIEHNTIESFYKKFKEHGAAYITADQAAMATCLCPQVAMETEECLASVSLHGETRGQMVPDVRATTVRATKQNERRCMIKKLNIDLYKKIMMTMLMDQKDAHCAWEQLV